MMKKAISIVLVIALCAAIAFTASSCNLLKVMQLLLQPGPVIVGPDYPIATENTEETVADVTEAPDDVTNHRNMNYSDAWVDKTDENKASDSLFGDIIITDIYKDCFFARTLVPFPYQIKLNGSLSEDWCIGDQVICTYENTYFDQGTYHVEADMLTINQSFTQLDPNVAYKPVIYLYPEKTTDVSVKLDVNGELLCTYPAYQNGWQVKAEPDGTLSDGKQSYSYLYWEGVLNTEYDFSKGFCVKGEDTAEFLETALNQLGLNRREANEFIVYWLEQMQTDAYTDAAKLDISPKPDTEIRVFMTWYSSQTPVEIAPQELSAPQRTGFTAVEWGGTKVG